MFELLVPAEKAQLDRVKGDKNAYDLEIRPRLMVQTIEELQDAELSLTSGRSKVSTGERIASRSLRPRAGAAGTKSDASFLGRGEDDETGARVVDNRGRSPGLYRLRRWAHRLLGTARRMAGQNSHPRGRG